MIARYTIKYKQALIALGGSLLITLLYARLVSVVVTYAQDNRVNSLTILIVCTLGAFICAVDLVFIPLVCYLLAKAKGYHGAIATLSLLGVVGLAIIFILPDRDIKIAH
jgi:hypothetical protein